MDKQEFIPVGCVPLASVAMGGGCLPRGVGLPPPPPTEFLTYACENITFPQLLLRAVKNN